MLSAFMRSSYRGAVALSALVLSACATRSTGPSASESGEREFLGYITDTECGANHAPMIAKGGMGQNDRECTQICVKKGATYGFVDAKGGGNEKGFYQLDDQDAPAPYAGRRVRIRGRIHGDTILVQSVAPAD
jgi:hypothetical protein